MPSSLEKYAPLEIRLQNFRLLTLSVGCLHVLAVIALLVSNVLFALQVAGVLILSASLILSLHEVLFCRTLCWDQNGRWSLVDSRGRKYPALLLGNTIVTVPLCVLQFRLVRSRSRISVVLFPGSCSDEERRRLRVRMRLERGDDGGKESLG